MTVIQPETKVYLIKFLIQFSLNPLNAKDVYIRPKIGPSDTEDVYIRPLTSILFLFSVVQGFYPWLFQRTWEQFNFIELCGFMRTITL